MRLSSLQKFILTECYSRKGRVNPVRSSPPKGPSGALRAGETSNGVKKKILLAFYDKQKEKPSVKDQVDTVTKSVESLIDKGCMVGYGVRTPKKWYIEEVRLMPKGRKIARKLLGEQQQLPLGARH